jgi:hypothetical protein
MAVLEGFYPPNTSHLSINTAIHQELLFNLLIGVDGKVHQ